MHGEASVYLREGRLPIVKKTANTQDLFPFCESTAGHIPHQYLREIEVEVGLF